MPSHEPRHYVQDLKTWDLPRLEDLERQLTDEFGPKARVVFLTKEREGDQLQSLFLERLRELAGTAVNEILEYWLKGLTDGCNGQFPELCVEVPFLERGEGEEPLLLAYCVDNEDGSRTELNRVTLERVFGRILEDVSAPTPSRLDAVARELRTLARTLETRAQALRG
jgi:hypothetical protein